MRFTESPRHPHVGLKRANSPVGPKLKAHVEASDAQRFIPAAAANNLDSLDAILKVRPDFVAAPWSSGDARRPRHYALMDRAPEMMRMLIAIAEERVPPLASGQPDEDGPLVLRAYLHRHRARCHLGLPTTQRRRSLCVVGARRRGVADRFGEWHFIRHEARRTKSPDGATAE